MDEAFSEIGNGELPIACPHFLLCRSVWYDPANSEEFSLGRLIVQLSPEGGEFPAVIDRIFAYGQLFGKPDEYDLRIELVQIELANYNEEIEVQFNIDGLPQMWRSTRPIVVSDDLYVSQFAFTLTRLYFPTPGIYEFQLFLDDFDQPIARERVMVGG